MELKIDLKKLQAALKACIEFIPTRSPLLGWAVNFIFRDRFIYATDTTVGIYYQMGDLNFGNGFMVRADDLNAYVQKLEGDQTVFKVGEDEDSLEVITGRRRATFALGKDVDKVSYVPGMSIDCRPLQPDFRDNLLEVKMSMHDTLPSMDGVFLHEGAAYSTNSKICTRCVCKSWPTGDIFLPRGLVKRVDELKDDLPLGLAVIESFIFIKYSNFVIFQRRLDEAEACRIQVLADIFDAFKGDNIKSVTFDREESIKSCSRISVFAEKEDRRISLKITPLLLVMSAVSKGGRSEEDLVLKGCRLLPEVVCEKFEVDCRYFARLLEVGRGEMFIHDLKFFSADKGVEYVFMGFTPQI